MKTLLLTALMMPAVVAAQSTQMVDKPIRGVGGDTVSVMTFEPDAGAKKSVALVVRDKHGVNRVHVLLPGNLAEDLVKTLGKAIEVTK